MRVSHCIVLRTFVINDNGCNRTTCLLSSDLPTQLFTPNPIALMSYDNSKIYHSDHCLFNAKDTVSSTAAL